MRLADNSGEQRVLEELLEASKAGRCPPPRPGATIWYSAPFQLSVRRHRPRASGARHDAPASVSGAEELKTARRSR